jgi:hypothetical protein
MSYISRIGPGSALAALALILGLAAPSPAVKPADPGKVQLRGAAFPVKEEAGDVIIVVKRQGGSTGQVTVDYATSPGTAAPGEDYEDTAGTLSWEDGDREDKTFAVPILDDDVPEGLELFSVALSNPSGGLDLGQPYVGKVHIKPSDQGDEGDDTEAGVIKLTSHAYSAIESDEEAEFVVVRKGGSTGAVTVDFMTIDGSAAAGEDYLETAGTLEWADGESGEKPVTVTLIDDMESEGLETITVVLTNVTGGAHLGGRDNASIVIVDDDTVGGECVPDEHTLCLQDGRFQVVGTWEDFDGNQGPFHVVPSTDGSGLIWFFTPDNVEILVKVLNACPVNGHYWVFYGAITNVGFTMEVTDLEAGVTRVYENPVGVVPLATTDTTAFPTCP